MPLASSRPLLVELFVPFAIFVAAVVALDAIVLARRGASPPSRATWLRGLVILVLFAVLGIVGAVTFTHHRLTDLPRIRGLAPEARPAELQQLRRVVRGEAIAFGGALAALAIDAAIAAFFRRRQPASHGGRHGAA